MAGLIGIGLSGVLGHQAALNTTANNITNANTPGYSRQEVQFETQEGGVQVQGPSAVAYPSLISAGWQMPI